MLERVRADMARYQEHGGWYGNFGFWVTLVYRVGAWGRRTRLRVVGLPVHLVCALLAVPIRLFLHVCLPTRTDIGGGLMLLHPYLVLVSSNSVIGKNCTLYHDVTLGAGTSPGHPHLEDNVVVFPGARVLGGVEIGAHAHVGANAVVVRDVPSWTFVVSPPVRRIPKAMAKSMVRLRSEGGVGSTGTETGT